MISPALADPRTVLAQFNFNKAVLPAFMALCMEDCPRPTTIDWLSERIHISSVNTIYNALRYMQNSLGIVFQVGKKRGGSRWWLAHEARQVALPFTRYLRPGDTRPFLISGATDSDSGVFTDARLISADGDSGSPGSLISADSGSDVPDSRLISSAIIPEKRELSTGQSWQMVNARRELEERRRRDGLLPSRIIPEKQELSLDQQLLDQEIPKQEFEVFDSTIEFASEVDEKRELLTWMGFWPEAVDAYCERDCSADDVAVILSGYWFAMANGFDSPAAFVRLCLERRRKPTTPYLQLAAVWQEMGEEERQTLLKALGQVKHHSKRHVILPRDFGYRLPYRELLLIWSACKGEIVPPVLAAGYVDDGEDVYRLYPQIKR